MYLLNNTDEIWTKTQQSLVPNTIYQSSQQINSQSVFNMTLISGTGFGIYVMNLDSNNYNFGTIT